MAEGDVVDAARKDGEEPSAVLLAIQEACGAAMRVLRATLDVLRTPSDVDCVGLARLGELAERTWAAGVPVHVTFSGRPQYLPVEVDQAGYRVVREARTNVARHAGPATATVPSWSCGHTVGADHAAPRVTPRLRAAPSVDDGEKILSRPALKVASFPDRNWRMWTVSHPCRAPEARLR